MLPLTGEEEATQECQTSGVLTEPERGDTLPKQVPVNHNVESGPRSTEQVLTPTCLWQGLRGRRVEE